MIQPHTATLPDVAFPGRDRLIAAFDAAVLRGDEHAVTAALRDASIERLADTIEEFMDTDKLMAILEGRA